MMHLIVYDILVARQFVQFLSSPLTYVGKAVTFTTTRKISSIRVGYQNLPQWE